MSWTNLEPIAQSEVRQKEKYKHHILTHIHGIQKDGTDEFTFREAMEKDTENRPMDMGEWRRDRVRRTQRAIWKPTIPHVKQTANGNLLCDPGDSNRGPVTIPVTGVRCRGSWEGGPEERGPESTYV